jgi:hypothetical protein
VNAHTFSRYRLLMVLAALLVISTQSLPLQAVAAAPGPSPAPALSVSLAAPTSVWATQSSTLTATANQDVGPTPYFISIYEESSPYPGSAITWIASCGSGTQCTASVRSATTALRYFVAAITTAPKVLTGWLTQSSVVQVDWGTIRVALQASLTTAPLSGAVTLTATTSTGLGPTPFYDEVFDATTGTMLARCGSGTTCTAVISQAAATTHMFLAYTVAPVGSPGYPPTGIQTTSPPAWVTWSSSSLRVSLSVRDVEEEVVATATANQDVRPTPYFIEIFNLTTGTRVVTCGGGTACSATFHRPSGDHYVVAFIAQNSTTLPPANAQAASAVAVYTFVPIN